MLNSAIPLIYFVLDVDWRSECEIASQLLNDQTVENTRFSV